MKKILLMLAIAASALSANALTITQFLTANPNVAGMVKDAVPFGDADRVTYVNAILSLGANVNGNTTLVPGQTLYTGAINYNGTVSLGDSTQGTGIATISGWDYVFVKYDGPNGGGIVYALNGGTMTLAGNVSALSPSGIDGWQGGISGWTAYGAHPGHDERVPDGGTTVAMLGLAFAGLGATRRFLKR